MADLNELQSIANEAVSLAEQETDPAKQAELIAIAEEAMANLEQAQQAPTEPEVTSSAAPAPSGRAADVPFADEAKNAAVEEARIAERKRGIMEGPLQAPSTQLFESLGPEDAAKLRKRYEEDPSFRDMLIGMDEVTVDGQRYLVPSADPGLAEKVYGGAINTGANILETGAAGIDILADKVVGEGASTLTESVQANIPKLKSDSLATTAVEVGVGMLSGAQVVNALSKAKTVAATAKALGPYISNTVRGVATVIGTEAGMSAAVDKDASTLVVGENAMIPVLEGFNIPEDATEAEKVLLKRGNILADSLLLAGPFTKLADGAIATAGFMKSAFADPLVGVFSKSAQEKALVQSILDRLASVTSASTEAEIKEVQRWLVDTIKANEELVVKMGQGEKDQIAVQYDTLTALQRGLDPEQAGERIIGVEANNIRQGALAKGSSELQDATEAPSRALETATKTVEGTGEAINPAALGVVREAEKPLRAAEEGVLTARAELSEAEQSIPVMIKEDPQMGAQIVNLEKDSGIEIYTRPNQAVDETVEGVRKSYEVMTAEKDALYEAVQGGTLTSDIVQTMFGRMDQEQLTQFLRSLPANSPVRELAGSLKPQTIKVVDEAGNPAMKPKLDAEGKPILDKDGKAITEQEVRKETPDEVSARIDNLLAESGIDFGYMYREVRPALAISASDLFASGSTASKQAGRQIRDAVHYIDNDLLDWVAKNSDPEVAQAAKDAKEYYVTTYAKYWKDGALGDVATLYDGTVGRTSAGMRETYGMEIQPVNFQQGSIDTITGILNDTQRAKTGQLIELLNTGTSSVTPATVSDYIISTALKDIARTVRSKGIDAVNTAEVAQSLSSYASILQKNYPEEFTRINAFLGKLNEAQGNVQLKRELLATAEEAAKDMQEELYTGVLNGFLKKNGVVNPNGYVTFSNLFNNPQSMDQLKEIVSLARQSDDPLIMEGIQQAYARNLRVKLLGGTREAAGSRALKLGESTKMLDDEASDLLAKGEIVFADKPMLMEGINSLISVTQGVAINKRGRAFAGASNTAFSQSAQQSIDRLIMAFIGPLTRLGARVRSGTGTIISRLAPDQAAAKTLDMILANPEEFTRIADEVLKDPKIPPGTYQRMFGLLIRAGIYNESDEIDYMNMIGQMEIEAEKAGNAISRQMQEIGIPQ